MKEHFIPFLEASRHVKLRKPRAARHSVTLHHPHCASNGPLLTVPLNTESGNGDMYPGYPHHAQAILENVEGLLKKTHIHSGPPSQKRRRVVKEPC